MPSRTLSSPRGVVLAAAVVVSAIPTAGAHAAAPIVGGATYSFTTGVGYRSNVLPIKPGDSVGKDAVVGSATRDARSGMHGGSRALRFGGSIDGVEELGYLGVDQNNFHESAAYAINADGVAVGYSQKYDAARANRGERAVRWDAGATTPVELGHLGLIASSGSTDSRAYAINDSGAAVGFAGKISANKLDQGTRAVRWDANTTVATELGNLGTSVPFAGSGGIGQAQGEALAINAAGTAVGFAEKFTSNGYNQGERAVRWDAGGTVATELATLGVRNDGYGKARAYAVNARGTAIGTAERYANGGNLYAAVRWDAGGTAAVELGWAGTNSRGSGGATVNAINDSDMIVGSTTITTNSPVYAHIAAARWDAGSITPTALPGLPGAHRDVQMRSAAYAVNASGTLAGYSRRYDAGGLVAGDAAVVWDNQDRLIDLITLLPATSGWLELNVARGISDTGWVSGIGRFDPDAADSGEYAYERMFLMLVPEAGSYGRGDANFDTSTNFTDLVILAQHYDQSNVTQDVNVADFNLDGVTDFADLVTLARNYNTSAASVAALANASFVADWALAQTLVPEPAACLALAGLMTRRRKPVTSRR